MLIVNHLTGMQTDIIMGENKFFWFYMRSQHLFMEMVAWKKKKKKKKILSYAVIIWTNVQKFILKSLVGIER